MFSEKSLPDSLLCVVGHQLVCSRRAWQLLTCYQSVFASRRDKQQLDDEEDEEDEEKRRVKGLRLRLFAAVG